MSGDNVRRLADVGRRAGLDRSIAARSAGAGVLGDVSIRLALDSAEFEAALQQVRNTLEQHRDTFARLADVLAGGSRARRHHAHYARHAGRPRRRNRPGRRR